MGVKKMMESNNIILVLQIYIYIIFAVMLIHAYAVIQLRTYEKQLNKKIRYWKKNPSKKFFKGL